jgi:hypothetical protein
MLEPADERFIDPDRHHLVEQIRQAYQHHLCAGCLDMRIIMRCYDALTMAGIHARAAWVKQRRPKPTPTGRQESPWVVNVGRHIVA